MIRRTDCFAITAVIENGARNPNISVQVRGFFFFQFPIRDMRVTDD